MILSFSCCEVIFQKQKFKSIFCETFIQLHYNHREIYVLFFKFFFVCLKIPCSTFARKFNFSCAQHHIQHLVVCLLHSCRSFQTKWSSSHRNKVFFISSKKFLSNDTLPLDCQNNGGSKRNENGTTTDKKRVRQNKAVKRVMWNGRMSNDENSSIHQADTARHKNDRKVYFDPGHNKINSFSFNFICLSVCYFTSFTVLALFCCLAA